MPVETVPFGDRGTAAPPAGAAASPDPYIHGSDETMVLDLRELRELAARDRAEPKNYRGSHRKAEGSGRGLAALGAPFTSDTAGRPGAFTAPETAETDRALLLYADGGTAIPLDRVREVCHDLRQPVAAILMLASAAETRTDVPEAVRLALQEITEQAEDISSAVRQFLDDAKQGVDGLGDPRPVDVAALADECVQRWRSTYQGTISISGDQGALHVTIDPVLFRRALGNVLSNGTRAAGDGGRVAVQIRRSGTRAVIVVEDSGPGFGKIKPGHGLGLTVVRRTVGAAGGTAEFGNGSLGGARITLTLPMMATRAAREIPTGDGYATGIGTGSGSGGEEGFSSAANRDFALASTGTALKNLALKALADLGPDFDLDDEDDDELDGFGSDANREFALASSSNSLKSAALQALAAFDGAGFEDDDDYSAVDALDESAHTLGSLAALDGSGEFEAYATYDALAETVTTLTSLTALDAGRGYTDYDDRPTDARDSLAALAEGWNDEARDTARNSLTALTRGRDPEVRDVSLAALANSRDHATYDALAETVTTLTALPALEAEARRTPQPSPAQAAPALPALPAPARQTAPAPQTTLAALDQLRASLTMPVRIPVPTDHPQLTASGLRGEGRGPGSVQLSLLPGGAF